ncbi:unnamed protein product [Sphenostylis stenocarpa]|uniref:Uncharacterized protein n=1 Tax=Sphenostylis stenocarpa TaxID=92480 RepID=A0AA86V137_9FABA|nr:unnamed protein product [Sphenostylis stenocarpa]
MEEQSIGIRTLHVLSLFSASNFKGFDASFVIVWPNVEKFRNDDDPLSHVD